MELLIFSITALISFAGGMIILSRSGARYGRSMAAGLLFLSGAELCYILFSFRHGALPLQCALFFEMAGAGMFLLSVTSMETGLARNKAFLTWERRILITAYASTPPWGCTFPR